MRADRSCPFDGRTAAGSSADLNLFDEDHVTYTWKASAAVVTPAALQLRSAGRDYRKPFLLGGCTCALRCCKAGLDRVPECQRHRIGL